MAKRCGFHTGGLVSDQNVVWDHMAEQDVFCESMADVAQSIANYFKGRIAYVNIMCNLSVDCDCCAVAEDPCMADIGILSSLDPAALDQACMDLIYQSDDPGRDHFIQRVESLHGTHTIDAAADLGFGTIVPPPYGRGYNGVSYMCWCLKLFWDLIERLVELFCHLFRAVGIDVVDGSLQRKLIRSGAQRIAQLGKEAIDHLHRRRAGK